MQGFINIHFTLTILLSLMPHTLQATQEESWLWRWRMPHFPWPLISIILLCFVSVMKPFLLYKSRIAPNQRILTGDISKHFFFFLVSDIPQLHNLFNSLNTYSWEPSQIACVKSANFSCYCYSSLSSALPFFLLISTVSETLTLGKL